MVKVVPSFLEKTVTRVAEASPLTGRRLVLYLITCCVAGEVKMPVIMTKAPSTPRILSMASQPRLLHSSRLLLVTDPPLYANNNLKLA
jgi:hypothetical protein